MPFKDPQKQREYWRAYWSRPENIEKRKGYAAKYRANHPDVIKVSSQRYYQANKQYYYELQKKSRSTYKLQAFEAYGGAICLCCGETHIEFLSIDHINGNGAAHRRTIGAGRSVHFNKWLRDHAYPPGFRVLCMNCNWALGKSGYCPHGNLESPAKPLI